MTSSTKNVRVIGEHLQRRFKQRRDRIGLIKFGMANDSNVEGLLLRIVTVLVDRSSEVNVTSVIADTGTIFQVTVAASDVGEVIGKGGRTARRAWGYCSSLGG